MTRTFKYIFPLANTWYNVWNDIISKDASFGTKLVQAPTTNLTVPDYQFDYAPFEASNVKLLKYQSQNTSTNPNNSGSVINRSSNPSQEEGDQLLAGAIVILAVGSGESNISLKEQWFRSTVAGSGIDIDITF